MANKNDVDLTSYFQDGERWERDIVRSAKRSRSVAWFVALIMTGTTCLSLVALVSLIPLQKFEPYLVVVDKSTGFMEVKSGLTRTENLTELKAITQANIVRFIKARESYDPFRIDENFGVAAILSTDDAARDLQHEYSTANTENPTRKYGATTEMLVNIASVTFPNETTAIVRFSTTEKTDTQQIRRNWISIVRYRYTDTPQTNEWRFENPLGFQVYNYRRDQETIRTDS